MITLYSYFRSSCSWRVRIALNLLGKPHVIKPINLLKAEQRSETYLAVNPLGTVPAITTETGETIWQSLAIIDYLDPKQTLLPTDPIRRAKCMQIANTICSEIQPLQNLSVVNRVAELAGGGEQGETAKRDWSVFHNRSKLRIIEDSLIDGRSTFCVDEKVTLADICLVPQLYSANRFGIDIEREFPKMMRIARRLEEMEAFQKAHAHAQADCPEDIKRIGVRF